MAKYVIDESTLTDIANSIRTKKGTSDIIKPEKMSEEIASIEAGGAPYEGDYEVTPKLEEQTLPTAQKLMKENLKIKEIPISVVSNTGGGNTVIIGG